MSDGGSQQRTWNRTARATHEGRLPVVTVLGPSLRVLAGEARIDGGTLPIGDELVRIGRNEENDVVVPSSSASRVHATLERRGNAVWLRDRSTNGTGLNTRLLRGEEAPLRARDCIFVGGATLEFMAPDETRVVLAGSRGAASLDDLPSPLAMTVRDAEHGDTYLVRAQRWFFALDVWLRFVTAVGLSGLLANDFPAAVRAVSSLQLGRPISLGTWLHLAIGIAERALPARAAGAATDPLAALLDAAIVERCQVAIRHRNKLAHGTPGTDSRHRTIEGEVATLVHELIGASAAWSRAKLIAWSVDDEQREGATRVRVHRGSDDAVDREEHVLPVTMEASDFCFLLTHEHDVLSLAPMVASIANAASAGGRHEVHLAREVVLGPPGAKLEVQCVRAPDAHATVVMRGDPKLQSLADALGKGAAR